MRHVNATRVESGFNPSLLTRVGDPCERGVRWFALVVRVGRPSWHSVAKHHVIYFCEPTNSSEHHSFSLDELVLQATCIIKNNNYDELLQL